MDFPMKTYHMVQYYKHPDSNPRVFIAPSKYIQGPGCFLVLDLTSRCHEVSGRLHLFHLASQEGALLPSSLF